VAPASTPLGRRFRILLGLLVTLIFLLHAAHWVPLPLLDRLESIAYDYRLRATMPGGLDRRVVIVDIDARSLAAEGHWPWRRDKLAELLDRLFDHYGISILGFDVVFAEPDDRSGLATLEALAQGPLQGDVDFLAELDARRPHLDFDARFAAALRDRDLILGYSWDRDTRIGQLPAPVLPLDATLGAIPFVSLPGYNANLPILQQAAYGAGFFDNPMVDQDGVFRRVPLLCRHGDGLYESLALAMVRGLYGQPPVEPVVVPLRGDRGEEWGLERLRIGGLEIPVDRQGVALIPYRGTFRSFPYVPATDVLNGSADPNTLRGAIVLVGSTAPGLLDLRSTPVQNVFPGVEVQANVIAGMLDQVIKKRPAYTLAAEVIWLLLLALLMIFLLPLLPPLGGILMVLLLAGATLAANLYLWQGQNLVLPLAGPLLLLLALALLHNVYGYLVEARAKRRLGHLFGQYVPPEIGEEMSAAGGDFGVHGESREMSVLFADVRGFTTISEGLSPDELTQLINAFLTPMTEVIHENRGTIDKYVGDMVMAFWGAPLRDPAHARHAVEGALAMSRRMQRVRQEFAARSWPEVRIGIGVNSGVMNVGNMGSSFRMAYTVLGDAVNLGSRLEGLTKEYGAEILVSESTRNAVVNTQGDDILFREMDRVRVKGKKLPVAIFEPLGRMDDQDPAALDRVARFHQALEAYRAQQWQAAEALLAALQGEEPNAKLYPLFQRRIQQLREAPPGSDWDGAFTFTTK
jgi:adenylate cyclase